jgi:hypothetical protein
MAERHELERLGGNPVPWPRPIKTEVVKSLQQAGVKE